MTEISQLVSDVKVEGNFDVTDAQALRWLTLRHQLMCVRSQCYRKVVDIGPTVVGQQAYNLPADLVKIRQIEVNGVRYDDMRESDIPDGQNGFLVLLGDGGVAAGTQDEQGLEQLALYPVPTDANQSILIRGAYRPPDLDISDDSTLRIPGEFREALVSGAIAIGLDRTEQRPDLASTMENRYGTGCEELRQQVLRKLNGRGAHQIRTDWR